MMPQAGLFWAQGEELEAVREAEPAKAYMGGRKPPAKADSASSLHPWVTGGPGSEARSGGPSTPPRSMSPASASPSPSESNLAHDLAHGHALLRSPMAVVRPHAALTQCAPLIALSHSDLDSVKVSQWPCHMQASVC